MGKVIFSLLALGLFVLAGTTISRNFMNSVDGITSEFVELTSRNENIIRTSISPVSTTLLPGRQILEITLRNDGETKIADFALCDVTVQYYDYLNNYHTYWLSYVEGTPGDNQWRVKGIYHDAATGTPELWEPGVLNTAEEIVLQAKLSPKAHISANNLAIISTPDGVKTWNYFRYMPLYLHNYPTPPVGDTDAQANLPLSYVVPTATVLYDYDTDLAAGAGRMIQQSVADVNETNLAEYQNWRILFSPTIFDTLEFDAANGKVPDIIHVSGDVYAIAYWGNNDDGFLKTVEVSSAGAITDTVVDTLEFDTAKGEVPDIIRVSGDIYAIAYQGDGDDGFLTTVEITSAGAITDTVVDTLEFETKKGSVPDIIHVSGDIYAIAYQGDGDDGILTTVEITSAGAITDTVVDTLEFDTVNGMAPSIIHVSGDIYAIAYQGSGDFGTLKTVEISSAGAITGTVVDTLEFDTANGQEPYIIHVSGDIYAVAYKGTDDDGILTTVEISSTGAITDTVIDTLEFDTLIGQVPDILHISGDIYAIAYQGDGDDGFLKTVEISFAGAITDTVIDTLEFDAVKGTVSAIIHVRGNIYTVVYQGDGEDGFLKTVNILPDGTFGIAIEIDGDVNLICWTAIKDFSLSMRGVVVAYLRDFDGTNYTEIASVTLDSADWQGGTEDWVETPIIFSDVSYTLSAGHYLELKLLVEDTSDDDMLFAYDTVDYNSYIELP
ncbi:hypothetical protein ACFLXD_01610 [Chloroflexota bacterium]